jgi:hypothetical protein
MYLLLQLFVFPLLLLVLTGEALLLSGLGSIFFRFLRRSCLTTITLSSLPCRRRWRLLGSRLWLFHGGRGDTLFLVQSSLSLGLSAVVIFLGLAQLGSSFRPFTFYALSSTFSRLGRCLDAQCRKALSHALFSLLLNKGSTLFWRLVRRV